MSSQNRFYKFARILPLALVLFAAGCGSREERAQSYYDRAMTLLDQGDIAKARIEFRNALKIKEDMLVAWRGMAKLEEKAKNWPGVTGALRRVVELDPKDTESGVRLAQLLFAGNALDEAMKIVTAATEVDDKNTSAHALRAAIFLRQGDGKSAVQEANKVLGMDSSNLDAMIVLAAEKLTRGDAKGALDTLDDIPKARQNELAVLFLRIRVYERLGDQPNIELVLRKLVDTNPKEQAYKRELVRYLVSNKRIDDAEKIMRDMVAENPGDEKVGMQLVSFLNMTKGPAAARAELRERIAKGGSVFVYQVADADFDFALGKTDEATQALKTLISTLKEPDQILQARTRLAEMYLARKNVPAGEAVVNEILQTDSRSTAGLRLRATIRIDRGQLEEAIADLRQALNDQPKSPELLTLMALAFERSGQIDLADKQYADAMRAANFSARSGLTYVGFLKRRGITGHAENVLAELAQRNPNNPQILAALAQEKLEQKDWNAAQEIATALRKENKGATADQITAAAMLGQNKLEEGLGALKSAYEANPRALQPMYALVRGYIQAKQTDKADAFLDTILKANPANAEALVLRGLTKLVLNAPDLAVQSFKEAIDKQPKNPVGYGALADYYTQRHDYDTAITTLKEGLRQQPGSFALQLAYAGLLEKKGEFDAAISEYEKMLKDQPGSLIVANNLASLLTDQRSDQASRERAMVVAAPLAKSQVPQFKDTLGWLYYQRGDYQNAVQLLEEAAAALPNNAWVKYHLGVTYAATGANDKASDQLQKALALEQNGDSPLKTKIQAALNK
jgi:tetratricopeptide (TPR) repeat protein